MSINVTELVKSRSGSGNNRLMVFRAEGSSDDAAIVAAVLAFAPTTQATLPRRGVSNMQPIDGNAWEVTVQYGNLSFSGANDPGSNLLFAFSTLNGGQVHITQSKQTLDSQAATWTSRSGSLAQHNAIGAGPDGSVQGTDVPLPGFSFTLRKKMLPANITASYILACYGLSCTFNSAPWSFTANLPNSGTVTLNFNAGEVTFYGVEAPEPNNDGSMYWTFHFSASPNLTNFDPGPDFSRKMNKRGSDYSWYRYVIDFDSTAGSLITRASDVFIEQLLDPGDFSGLALTS